MSVYARKARRATHLLAPGAVISIVGLMIESNLVAGNQSIPADLSKSVEHMGGSPREVVARLEAIPGLVRAAIESQQARSFYEKDAAVLSPAEALFLATQGGAEALGNERLPALLGAKRRHWIDPGRPVRRDPARK